MQNIVSQLKQRQVFRVATIYAVSAWPLIQIADLSVPALGLPDSFMTLLLQIFIAGFPVSLLFAWFFNFTTDGIILAKTDIKQENSPQVTLKTTIAVAGTLLLAFTLTLATQLYLGQTEIKPAPEQVTKTTTDVSSDSELSTAKQSIAILPFIAFSNDKEDEFFADGMVEELLNLLAKIPNLQVAARTSSFAYKSVTNKTIVEIGQELGVDIILEGSIRKNDTTNKIRITAQLIKVSSGEHLWSETYDREYRDIFQIQDDIARAVVKKMKSTLFDNQKQIQFVAETNSVDAMIAFGKGQNELSHRTITSIKTALKHFQQASSFDPNYARAYVGIADAYMLLAEYGNLSSKETRINAQKAIDKALTLDANLAAAYASQGLLLSYFDNNKAEQAFKKAISLNPNYAMAHMWYGTLLKSSGRLKSALQHFEQAFELDPKSPVAAYNLAKSHYSAGSEEKSMNMFSHIIANDPYYPGAYNLVGDILSNRGRLDDATAMYQRAIEIDPANKSAIFGLLHTAIDIGNTDSSTKWLEYAAQQPAVFSASDLNQMKALYYFARGEKSQAIAYLNNNNYDEKMSIMNYFLTGEKAIYQGLYPVAIDAFEKMRQQDLGNEGLFYLMSDGQAAIHLIYAYQQVNQSKKANSVISDFERYLQASINKAADNPAYYYNMAQVQLLKYQQDQALYYMQAAIDAGWVQAWKADIEPVFSSITDNTQFKQMMGGVAARLATMRTKIAADEAFMIADQATF